MAQKRKDWNGLISGFSASDLVFLDESGYNTDMTRRYSERTDSVSRVLHAGNYDRIAAWGTVRPAMAGHNRCL